MNKHNLLVCIFYCINVPYIESKGQQAVTRDGASSRQNTLSDDADDIQKQLDIEARDRFHLHPNTLWIFDYPPKFPSFHGKKVTERYRRRAAPQDVNEPLELTLRGLQSYRYENQREWRKTYPSCGGFRQSPVSLPSVGLRRLKGARPLSFVNFNAVPESMVVENNGKTLTLYGRWKPTKWPMLRGGAANNRIYLFHSLTLHWPSEHVIEDLSYPLESQMLYRSADYKDYASAIAGSSKDQLAILAVSTLYEFSNHTHEVLDELMKATYRRGVSNVSVAAVPLRAFSPPFQQYVSYEGSLTAPPCTEAVLWLVRARSLPVKRDFLTYVEVLNENVEEMRWSNRRPQPLNDRKLCYFC